jgi:hypothetical protein
MKRGVAAMHRCTALFTDAAVDLAAVCLAAVCLAAAAPALAAGAHQHGVARLEVVADGNSLAITLDSPLDNLLSFERAPRTAAERSAVQAMAQQLRNTALLPQPTLAAGCTLRSVTLVSGVLAPALLDAPAAPAPAAAGAAPATAQPGGHADLEASWQFDCRTPQALKGLALTGLFQAFPRLRQLDVALVAPGKQRGARATPQSPQLAW